MAESSQRIVGIKFVAATCGPGFGVVPLVPFPASREERSRAQREASKAALLLRRPSAIQRALFRQLIEASPDKSYIATSSKWIGTILKATEGLSAADIERLRAFNWAERSISAADLRRELSAALEPASPTRD